ncbi:hypothetical protein ACE1ET_05865 [Saccharicrinis sp. FJH62]|uniref:hypothetical protein n=1 Tax=Saccharicrinis sp. FJH62 TaxID=3344657 RepID=UPI0035D447EF
MNSMRMMIGRFKVKSLFRFQYQAGLAAILGRKTTYCSPEEFFDSTVEQFITAGLVSKLGFKIIPLYFLPITIFQNR